MSRHLSLKEGTLIGGFVLLTWAWFRNSFAPMDALDPDFVKYHLIAIPVGAELLLNVSSAKRALAAAHSSIQHDPIRITPICDAR